MKKNILGVILGLGLAVFTAQANASLVINTAMIGLSPASATLNVGDSVDLDLTISGLGDFTALSLGAFDVDIGFDSSVLSFGGAVFGSLLGDESLGEAILDVDASVAGLVNLFEVSFLFDFELDAIQPASFTLATLTFNGLANGASLVGVAINDIGDGLGDPLAAFVGGDPVVTVNAVAPPPPPPPPPVPVPEPGSLALFLAALIGFGALRRFRLSA